MPTVPRRGDERAANTAHVLELRLEALEALVDHLRLANSVAGNLTNDRKSFDAIVFCFTM